MSRNRFILLFVVAITLLIITIIIVVKPNKNQSVSGTQPDKPSFFPIFGNSKPNPDTTNPQGDTPKDGVSNPISQNNNTTDSLFNITTKPVAGMLSETKEVVGGEDIKKDSIWINYVLRENGFIYKKEISNLSFEKKVSTTTIPRVEEALFLNNGKSVVLRYLDSDLQTIKTFLGTVPQEKEGGDGPSVLKGSFLPEGIKEFSKSMLGKYYFYLLDLNESVSGTLVNSKTNTKSAFFNSPFREWSTAVSENGSYVFVTTKPSSVFSGYSYRLAVPNNNPVRILGGVLGLTINPNSSGNSALYSDNTLALKNYSISDKKTTSFGFKTLAEKCAWVSDNITAYCFAPTTTLDANYPDEWYQGVVHFTDSLWKINTSTGSASFIENISDKNKGTFDGIKPTLSGDDSILFFINKNDGSLWGYKLNE